ncbi:MAG: hypothetical protein ACREX8_14690, partial [Gammaproteobacteria bacterium]
MPAVHAEMLAGLVDRDRALVFVQHLAGLPAELIAKVLDAVLAAAPGLTTGQLVEQIKKLAIAVDPDWARRRYEQAVADRKVVGYRNADGSANLSGCNLPLDRVAAASGHIDALAKAAKRAGDRRPLDHIRADLFLGMTDGTYTGLNDAEIIQLLTTACAPDTDQPDSADDDEPDGNGPDTEGPGSGGPDDSGPDDSGPDDSGPDDSGPADTAEAAEGGDQPVADEPADARSADVEPQGGEAQGGEADECRSPEPGASPTQPARATVGAGLELRVRLSTLLGHDQYPAELAGWGPVHAELARDLAATLHRAQWWFAVVDGQGHLLHSGTTRARPTGARGRGRNIGDLVEVHVHAALLTELATDPASLGHWAS